MSRTYTMLKSARKAVRKKGFKKESYKRAVRHSSTQRHDSTDKTRQQRHVSAWGPQAAQARRTCASGHLAWCPEPAETQSFQACRHNACICEKKGGYQTVGFSTVDVLVAQKAQAHIASRPHILLAPLPAALGDLARPHVWGAARLRAACRTLGHSRVRRPRRRGRRNRRGQGRGQSRGQVRGRRQRRRHRERARGHNRRRERHRRHAGTQPPCIDIGGHELVHNDLAQHRQRRQQYILKKQARSIRDNTEPKRGCWCMRGSERPVVRKGRS